MTATSEAAVTPESYAASPGKRWYVVHAYSGMEKAVERNLREVRPRVISSGCWQ